MKKIKYLLVILLCFLLVGLQAGCDNGNEPSPNHPVTVTIWHTYTEDVGRIFKSLVDEFNATEGAKKGVVVDVALVDDASDLNKRILEAETNLPGVRTLPDMALVYPQVALLMANQDILVDLNDYFTEAELNELMPQFVEEGRLGGDKQYLLPFAKSTEVLYVNRNIFDRFAADTGVEMSDLYTVEGILDTAKKYYQWSGGKDFFYPENLFNFTTVAFNQLNKDFFLTGHQLDLHSPTYQQIWDSYYPLAVQGGTAVYNRYGDYLAITGDVVCVTSTSAGALYYPETITYEDNTKEDAIFDVLPYPVFNEGNKVAIRRGGGICIIKSKPQKEYAASVFLKWLTKPEQNLKFTRNTGYMPVVKDAVEETYLSQDEITNNDLVTKVQAVIKQMDEEYIFYTPPIFETYDTIANEYSNQMYITAQKDSEYYQKLIESGMESDLAWEQVSQNALQDFIESIEN